MKLSEFLTKAQLCDFAEAENVEISSICVSSEKCKSGAMFFCFDSKTCSFKERAKRAIKKGAVALVSEKPLTDVINECLCERSRFNGKKSQENKIYNIVVDTPRDFLTRACKLFYGNPQKKLRTVAIVGTNGKTSVCTMIKNILCDSKISCGAIGTFGAVYGEKQVATGMTTPDAPELYALLADMAASGVKVVCMELSAHAIYFKKADFTFDITVFTNCSPEHLDFFESYNAYCETKISAFSEKSTRLAVVNSDDSCFAKISNLRSGGLITYGINNPSDVFAIDAASLNGGLSFVLNLFDAVYRIKSSLVGIFNVYNMLAAATVCALCGVKTARVAKSLCAFLPVSGRMERICLKRRIYVDYAHTPAGLECALKALCEIKGSGKLICVFGCGGNRDKKKRPVMGEISGKYADFTVITSDNPRFEEPSEIIAQIEGGIRKVTLNYIIISDREQAIKYAVNSARENDVVLIAGKGAEEYQEVMGAFRRFSDKEAACAVFSGDDE